jgi:hypothetical protein
LGRKVDKYLDEGMAEDEAKHKANRNFREEELDKFMLKYVPAGFILKSQN